MMNTRQPVSTVQRDQAAVEKRTSEAGLVEKFGHIRILLHQLMIGNTRIVQVANQTRQDYSELCQRIVPQQWIGFLQVLQELYHGSCHVRRM